MILVGIGANLPTLRYGEPRAGCEAALAMFLEHGLKVSGRSRWYESAPVPASDQPWYVNGVAAVETALDALGVLAALQAVEARFGRVRSVRNAPRAIDLDLLAYDDLVLDGEALTLPHPRMGERAFVLLPLREVTPDWRDPRSGQSLEALIARLPPGQIARPIADEVPHR